VRARALNSPAGVDPRIFNHRRGIDPAFCALNAQNSIGGFRMNKFLTAAAVAAVALVGLSGAARAADCVWAGNHYDCGDRHIYPKWYYSYPAPVIAQPPSPEAASHPTNDYYGPRPY